MSKLLKMMLASLLPMLIMIFIVAGAMGIGNDTIAGEKERGTISTLLMAPISKNEIVLGKISAAVILTILSAMGSFIGIVASIPNAGPLFGETGNVAFGFATYLQLFVIIVMTALISVSAFVTTSTLAKNAKEAANYSMPLYMGILMLNVITQFSQLGEVSQLAYLIPFYNSILGIKSALMQDLTTINLLCIIVSNIALFVVLSISTIKLFKNEKVMFGK